MQPHSRAARPYHPGEIAADFAIHLLGMTAGAVGATALLALAAADRKIFWPVLVYAVSMMAMFCCSAAYHLHRSSVRRELLRRLDHAAIFAMIAGTYTPFTASVLTGAAAAWATGSMWLAALAGVAIKLMHRRALAPVSVLLYLALGWAAVIFMRPLLAALDQATAVLILLGGVLYSVGAGIHCWRRLPFHDAIWHGLVLSAASCHYVAILHGVVLAGSR